MSPTARQWREAANELRAQAIKYDENAERVERLENPPRICAVISNSGADGEPLACAHDKGHGGTHSWASLPTFTRERTS